MFSNKKEISVSYKAKNEDCFYLADDLAFVIDGASGLDKINITNEISDAAWYSHNIKDAILEFQNESDIREVLFRAVKKVNGEYRKLEGFEQVKDFPSAVIAMARKKEDFLEILVLGDCMCILQKRDMSVERVEDTRIETFDKRAIQYGMLKREETGLDFCDTKVMYRNILISNRTMKNKPGGYYCLSDDDAAIHEAYVKKYRLDDIRAIGIMSDGFSQILDLFHLYDDKSFLSTISQKDLHEIYDELYDAQCADRKMNIYPRFSKSDDATLLYFEINGT